MPLPGEMASFPCDTYVRIILVREAGRSDNFLVVVVLGVVLVVVAVVAVAAVAAAAQAHLFFFCLFVSHYYRNDFCLLKDRH